MADWPYLTNWSSDLDLQGHMIFRQYCKYVYWIHCFQNHIVDIRIMITSSTVHEIWLIDPIWPTLSSDLYFQDLVSYIQYWKYVSWIPCSLKPYSRHQNNDYIVYGSRNMADWPYLTNFVKWPWLTRSRDLQAILKICFSNSPYLKTLS